LLKDIATTPRWMAMASHLHDLLIARERVSFSEVAQLDGWAQRAGLEKISYERVHTLWYAHEIHRYRLALQPLPSDGGALLSAGRASALPLG